MKHWLECALNYFHNLTKIKKPPKASKQTNKNTTFASHRYTPNSTMSGGLRFMITEKIDARVCYLSWYLHQFKV